jgi:hypothetical protein
MTIDALRLEVPDIVEESPVSLAELNQLLAQTRTERQAVALQQVLSLLLRCNRSAMTLLERQRALQSFSDEYRHHAKACQADTTPPTLFVHLCSELAMGFKRLLLQILQGRQPSQAHLAWCLYMAQHFLGQCQLRH